MSDYKPVEGHSDLIKDMHSKAVINTNRSAYLAAVQRKRTLQQQKDELRDATREINTLKCEMHEIKDMLKTLLDRK